MAEDGGLFSGLKFSDIWFPAAASIASMYNPHIGRGLQTGLNLFNSFQDFQNSARYYKQLKEQQEREQAGIDKARAGIQTELGLIQADINALPTARLQGDPRGQGPLLDESETSKFTLFGDEGPELADPNQFSLHMKALSGLQDQPTGGEAGLDLGIESLANPRFSEIDTQSIFLNDEIAGERKALEKLLRQQNINLSLLDAAPGVAAQGAMQAGYVPLDAAFRDEARRKDLLAAFQQQQRAYEIAELERQADIQAVRDKQKIYDEGTNLEHKLRMEYLREANLPDDPDKPLTYSQGEQLDRHIWTAYKEMFDPNLDPRVQAAAKSRVLMLAREAKERGRELAPEIEQLYQQYIYEATGKAAVDPSGTVASHTPGQYPRSPTTAPTVGTRPRQQPNVRQEDVDAFGYSVFGNQF